MERELRRDGGDYTYYVRVYVLRACVRVCVCRPRSSVQSIADCDAFVRLLSMQSRLFSVSCRRCFNFFPMFIAFHSMIYTFIMYAYA